MIVQNLLVITLFSLSFAYVIRKIYKTFTAKSSCESCAGSCSKIDIEKIVNQINNYQ